MISELKKEKIPTYQPGSINYLLYGARPSNQSINIRIGNRFETLLNDFSQKVGFPPHELASQLIAGHQVDSLFELNEGTLEYDEQKMNAGLDSEKTTATINKILEVKDDLLKSTGKKVIGAIFHTSVWEKNDAPKYNSYYEKYKKSGVYVKFMSEYFSSRNVEMTKEEYYSMWRNAGDTLLK
jgi:hypothetical protein